MSFRVQQQTSGKTKERVSAFVRKAYEILEQGKFSDIICWSTDGKSVIIKDTTTFAQKVLPLYFKHSNFTSFVRQLNMYDFHKRKSSGKEQIFVHDYFQRGQRQLLKNVQRKGNDASNSRYEEKYESSYTSYYSPSNLTTSFSTESNTFTSDDVFLKISLLEKKIKELDYENQLLSKKIMAKDQRQSSLVRMLSQALNSNSAMVPEANDIYLKKEESFSSTASDNIPCLSKYNSTTSWPMTTPETNAPTDSQSNVDSYLNFDQTYSEDIQESSSNYESYCSPVEDNEPSFLVKRRYSEEEEQNDFLPENQKQMCFQLFEGIDNINLFADGFSLFSHDMISQRI